MAMVVGLASVLAACTGSHGYRVLDRGALRATRPRSILVTRWRPPGFTAGTADGVVPLGMVFGVVGLAATAAVAAVVADSAGETVTGGGVVDDPAVFIRSELAAALARRFSLTVAMTDVDPKTPQTVWVQPVSHLQGADLLLDVRTHEWGIVPTRWSHYGVKYEGSFTLFDLRTQKPIAQGICSSHPIGAADDATFDEIRANNGQRLRDEVQATAQFCADDYRKRILGLY
jgi:hypothetical protein